MRSAIVFVILATLAAVALGGCGRAGAGATAASSLGHKKDDAARASGSTAATHTARRGRLLGDEDDDDPSRSANAGNTNDKDADFDNDSTDNVGKGYRDRDDGAVVSFGHAASAADRRAIVSVVKRYYAAAAAGDAPTACSLTFSLVAESMSEDFGHAPGPLYLRGAKTCTEVLSRMFKRLHGELAEPVAVTAVRVKEHRAYAVLGWHAMPAGETELRRELGVWRIDRVLSSTLP